MTPRSGCGKALMRSSSSFPEIQFLLGGTEDMRTCIPTRLTSAWRSAVSTKSARLRPNIHTEPLGMVALPYADRHSGTPRVVRLVVRTFAEDTSMSNRHGMNLTPAGDSRGCASWGTRRTRVPCSETVQLRSGCTQSPREQVVTRRPQRSRSRVSRNDRIPSRSRSSVQVGEACVFPVPPSDGPRRGRRHFL